MSPVESRCSRCETPLFKTKYSKTFKGRLERLFQRVGIAAVVSVGAVALLLFLGGGLFIAFYVLSQRASSDDAAIVNTIVNESFSPSPGQPASFKIAIPHGTKNSRVVGGFKVTPGTKVDFYILTEDQFAQWSNGTVKLAVLRREGMASTKVRQPLMPGIYYLVFASPDSGNAMTVAAEFYSKYD